MADLDGRRVRTDGRVGGATVGAGRCDVARARQRAATRSTRDAAGGVARFETRRRGARARSGRAPARRPAHGHVRGRGRRRVGQRRRRSPARRRQHRRGVGQRAQRAGVAVVVRSVLRRPSRTGADWQIEAQSVGPAGCTRRETVGISAAASNATNAQRTPRRLRAAVGRRRAAACAWRRSLDQGQCFLRKSSWHDLQVSAVALNAGLEVVRLAGLRGGGAA